MALLDILTGSLDWETALDAAMALAELRREVVSHYPDSSTRLRDLSVALANVWRVEFAPHTLMTTLPRT